jgi:opacity protein-like surface antigen
MRSRIGGAVLGVAASLVLASSALATDCVNASKANQGAGVQLVIDAATGEIVWTTPGLAHRVERGIVDPDSGEGFHGLIGLDFDGDAVADIGTWFGVGPEGTEIPDEAQLNGPACRGVTNIGVYLTECLGS